MPTAIFDASLITFRKRAGTLAAFKTNLDLQNTTNNVVYREQPTFQSSEIISTRIQGKCICNDNNANNNFNRQTPGACGCAR
jgi:hypothetical protein